MNKSGEQFTFLKINKKPSNRIRYTFTIQSCNLNVVKCSIEQFALQIIL